jgi:hypothetical protein
MFYSDLAFNVYFDLKEKLKVAYPDLSYTIGQPNQNREGIFIRWAGGAVLQTDTHILNLDVTLLFGNIFVGRRIAEKIHQIYRYCKKEFPGGEIGSNVFNAATFVILAETFVQEIMGLDRGVFVNKFLIYPTG